MKFVVNLWFNLGEVGFPSSDPRYHKLTNKCNARVFYGGGGLHVPVGRGVDGEERL